MMGTIKARERVNKFGEVFTPAATVFKMVLADDIRDTITGVDKKIIDPSAGQGQFPCAIVAWKMFFNIDKHRPNIALKALNSVTAIDIQQDNCDECKAHLLATVCDAYKFFFNEDFPVPTAAAKIIQRNVHCFDSLKWVQEFNTRKDVEDSIGQLSLF